VKKLWWVHINNLDEWVIGNAWFEDWLSRKMTRYSLDGKWESMII
jgi:hypothetical protein